MRKYANKKGARDSWVVPFSLFLSFSAITPVAVASRRIAARKRETTEHKTRGNHKHPCTRERGCMIHRKNIYERRRGAHCYKLTVDSLESSLSTLSPLSLSPSFSHLIVPSDQFPSPTPRTSSRASPRPYVPYAILSFADTTHEVPGRALPFSSPLRYSFKRDTMCVHVYCAYTHERGRVCVP